MSASQFGNDFIQIDNIIETPLFANISKVQFTVLTQDVSLVNLLRRSILSEIETFAIDIVGFHINNSPRHDEILALRFGQLIIDHRKFQGPDGYETELDVTGPIEVTTDDIQRLPFINKTSIVSLKEGQRLHCKLIVKKGTATTHVKWRPVSAIKVQKINAGYEMSFKNIGMLPTSSIIQQGIEKLVNTATIIPQNIFSRPLIPQNLIIPQKSIPDDNVQPEEFFGVIGEE